MSLTFYFAPYSTASVTEAVIAELGLSPERVEVAIGLDGTQSAAYRAINPNGRVPTIVHDGVTIWESAAITLYLGEVFGVTQGLFPETGPQRGEAMKWVIWTNMVLAEAGSRLSAMMAGDGAAQEGSIDWVAPEMRSAAAAEQAKSDVHGALKILDAELSGKSFVLGEYSLVDTHMQGFVGWLTMIRIDLSPYPEVAAWLGRCMKRPAVAALMSQDA